MNKSMKYLTPKTLITEIERQREEEAEEQNIDLYEAIANDPELYLDMELRPGDIQLISNHTILHARTAYEDDPDNRRHLLRLWLSLE